jgi:hypothetical protein
VTQETPVAVVNRSALPAISYRVGTYPTFFASMQAALSSSSYPALASLRTRDSSDFSIALVDAWSEVLDILTFYTERLANEAYLGTAIESRSVFELARLVGYKPSPGVSASTVLAFTLATAPGSPAIVPIPAGTRVQSVPGPGQAPQVFESAANLTATIANNAISAATSIPFAFNGGETSTWITGTANNIQVGNALLFVAASNGIPNPSGAALVAYVTAVSIDPIGGNTQITWNAAIPKSLAGDATEVCLYIFRTKAALYGTNAPAVGMFAYNDLFKNIPGAPSAAADDWNWQAGYTDYSNKINLDNAYPGLNPTASGATAPANQSEWMVLTGPQIPYFNGSLYNSFFQIQSATETNPALFALSAKTTQLTLSFGTVLQGDTSLDLNEVLYKFVGETRTTTAYVGSQLLTFANLPIVAPTLSSVYPYTLTTGMIVPTSGEAILLTGIQPIGDNAPIGVSGKRVRIAPLVALSGSNGGFTPTGATGALPVSINQPFLIDAFPPTTDPISGNLLWTVLTTTGQPGTLSVPAAPANFILQPSVTADPLASEATLVSIATVSGLTTSLGLAASLNRIYDTPTVNVNANAVEASHGETMREIMGSGDATNSALQFQLKQSPLTYTSASTASGVQSTLQVRVNNLLWNEVPNFLNSAPSDRAFVTRPNSTGGPTVQFGDGIEGSRTPTGTSNIQAQYRKGIGIAGMVSAGQLTQPLDRPQGLQYVTNPSSATGGADPATPANAQQSAPLPTLTLGRVVSLEDYQNFALGFAGISMALATWTWFGSTRGIFLTLAGEGGTIVNATDQVVQNLMQAYQNYGPPNMPVLPVSYQPQNFEIGMQVMVNSPTYDPTVVVPQVWQALTAAFAFGQLAPGQNVAASQIIQIAQSIPGVTAVNLTALNLSGTAAGVVNLLCASGPIPGNASGSIPPTGAQILLLDPASVGNVGVRS